MSNQQRKALSAACSSTPSITDAAKVEPMHGHSSGLKLPGTGPAPLPKSEFGNKTKQLSLTTAGVD
jgi:hypothetical protein